MCRTTGPSLSATRRNDQQTRRLPQTSRHRNTHPFKNEARLRPIPLRKNCTSKPLTTHTLSETGYPARYRDLTCSESSPAPHTHCYRAIPSPSTRWVAQPLAVGCRRHKRTHRQYSKRIGRVSRSRRRMMNPLAATRPNRKTVRLPRLMPARMSRNWFASS